MASLGGIVAYSSLWGTGSLLCASYGLVFDLVRLCWYFRRLSATFTPIAASGFMAHLLPVGWLNSPPN